MVKGGDLGGTEAFSDGNDRRVDCTKAEIGILLNQLRRPFEVGLGHVFDCEAPGDKTAEEGTLDRGLGALSKQVTNLGYDEIRDAQRRGHRLEPGDARLMIGIIEEGSGYERPGVDNDRDQPNPSASRSSSAALAENPGFARAKAMKSSPSPTLFGA
jgi:hypothetical protein